MDYSAQLDELNVLYVAFTHCDIPGMSKLDLILDMFDELEKI